MHPISLDRSLLLIYDVGWLDRLVVWLCSQLMVIFNLRESDSHTLTPCVVFMVLWDWIVVYQQFVTSTQRDYISIQLCMEL